METKNKVIIDLEVKGNDELKKFEKLIKDLISLFKTKGETSKKAFDDVEKAAKKAKTPIKELGDTGKKVFETIEKTSKKAFDTVKTSINYVLTPFKKVGEVGKKAFETIGNAAKKVATPFKAFGEAGKKAFNGLNTVMKGSGIIGLFLLLWEALKKNQKIMDGVNTVINAMGVVIKPVIDGVVKFVENIQKNETAMDALTSVAEDLIKIGLTPMKLAFNGIKLVVAELELGWLKVKEAFGGKIDTSRITELKENIKASKEGFKETAKEGAAAVKDMTKVLPTAVSETAKVAKGIVGETIDAYSKMTLKGVLATSNAQVKAVQNIEALERKLTDIRQTAETEEEKLRQTRDDITKSDAERKQASIDLEARIAKQKEDEIAIINQQIAAQQILVNQDKSNIENKNKLSDLQNKIGELNSRITGQYSEQLTSHNSLIEEINAGEQARVDFLNKLNDEELEDKATTEEEKALLAEKRRHDERIAEIESLGFKKNNEKLYNDLIKTENEKFAKNQQKIKIDAAKTEQEKIAELKLGMTKQTDEEIAIQSANAAKKKRDEEIEALNISEKEKSDLKIKNAEYTEGQIKDITDKAREDEKDKDKKKLDEDLAKAKEKADKILEFANNAIAMQENIETISQNKKYSQRLADINNLKVSEEEKNKLREKAEKDNAKALAKIEEKAAKQKDKTAKAEVLVNAALAVIKTWAGYASMNVAGAILATAQTIAIGAMAGAQISAIDKAASERGSSGSYANGGIIPGSSYTGDKLSANVNSGEMILNQEQQAKLFNQVNSGGDSYMNAEMIAQAVIKAIQSIPVVITEQAITEKQKEVKIRESRFSY